MERDDLTTPDQQEPASSALKQPEPPDTEAVELHHDEGSGPFGADMQHLRGGTRQSDPQHEASPYSTGTNSSGASMSPADPRSAFAPERTGAGPAQSNQEGPADAVTTESTAGAPAAGEHPDIRWDK